MSKLISVVQYNDHTAEKNIRNTFAKLISGNSGILTRVRCNGHTYRNSFASTEGFTNLIESNKFSIQVKYE